MKLKNQKIKPQKDIKVKWKNLKPKLKNQLAIVKNSQVRSLTLEEFKRTQLNKRTIPKHIKSKDKFMNLKGYSMRSGVR